MVESSSSNGSPGGDEEGVFANLPRTRPQRDSPRRAAARNSSSAAAAAARKRDGSPSDARPKAEDDSEAPSYGRFPKPKPKHGKRRK